MPASSAARSIVQGAAAARSSSCAGRVIAQERLVGPPLLEQIPNQSQRHGQVGARTHRQVQVRDARQWRAARIDHDELARRPSARVLM